MAAKIKRYVIVTLMAMTFPVWLIPYLAWVLASDFYDDFLQRRFDGK